MNEKSIVSPEDQGATFVELFFDLVFVFAITQVTHYAAHHLDAQGIVRSVLVFWLIWWGWTQFTWALNAANTDHHEVRVGTLVSTAVAFVMAACVEHAFSAEVGQALWFALSYIGVRTLGLGLYYRVAAANDDEQRSAVARFGILSLSGFAAVVLGAFLDPSLRIWVWSGAVLLDLGASKVASRSSGWSLNGGHFAERHGLIVIIALGESLIVAGSAVVGSAVESATVEILTISALALLMTCLLWWTYFGWVREVLEERLMSVDVSRQPRLARDAYSLGHFPLVCGIIALAVGFEAVFHPDDYSVVQAGVALGSGLGLFLVSTAAALWRAEGCILWNRILVLGLTLIALYLARGTAPAPLLAIVCAGLALIVAIEQITVRRRLARL